MRFRLISNLVCILCLAAAAASCAGEKQQEPSVFKVTRTSSAIPSADPGSISYRCDCDKQWTAKMLHGSWARITNISTGSDGSGTFDVAYDFNPEQNAREDSLIVTSGGKRYSTVFKQQGLSSVLSASGVSVKGLDNASFKITLKSPWTAEATNTKAAPSWFDFSPKSSNGGTTAVTVTTTEVNTDKSDRNAFIRFNVGGKYFFVTVTQKPSDAIILSSDRQEMSNKGGVFSVQISHNISYTCAISEDASSWIKSGSTKAPDSSTETFTVSAHSGTSPRSGEIYFFNGDVRDTLTVYQAEADQLVLSTPSKTVGYRESTFEVSLRSNIQYEYSCSASWLRINETKSMRTDIKTVSVDANEDSADRSATISFKDVNSELSSVLTVTQLGKGSKEYLGNVTPGVYGLGTDLQYRRFTDQILTGKRDGASFTCILDASAYTYIDISGLPSNPEFGQRVSLTLKQNREASLAPSAVFEAEIEKVGDQMVWLCTDDNIQFIMPVR